MMISDKNIGVVRLDAKAFLSFLDLDGGLLDDVAFVKGKTEEVPRQLIMTIRHPDFPERFNGLVQSVALTFKVDGNGRLERTQPPKRG